MNISLPFVERFRPIKLDDVVSHYDTIQILKNFIKEHSIPHLLFYGPSGTGKTSTIEAFVNELYGSDYVEYMVMNINASEERGIDIVRNKIKNFVSTKPLMNKKETPKYKFVLLDEADAMTHEAQGMLKQVIEYYTDNARFCLICNCIKKINPAIKSRCTVFNFPPIDFDNVVKKIKYVSEKIDINVSEDGLKTIWKISNGDMRKVMHLIQMLSINNKSIDSKIVTTFQKYPIDKDINDLYKILMKGKFHKSLFFLNDLLDRKYYFLTDILTELTLKIVDDIYTKNIEIDKATKLLLNLRDIEMNLIVTFDTEIQVASLVAVFS